MCLVVRIRRLFPTFAKEYWVQLLRYSEWTGLLCLFWTKSPILLNRAFGWRYWTFWTELWTLLNFFRLLFFQLCVFNFAPVSFAWLHPQIIKHPSMHCRKVSCWSHACNCCLWPSDWNVLRVINGIIIEGFSGYKQTNKQFFLHCSPLWWHIFGVFWQKRPARMPNCLIIAMVEHMRVKCRFPKDFFCLKRNVNL